MGYLEKRSIQYSKSSKASFSFSPWTSWTIRPPMRSIEGISIRSSFLFYLALTVGVPPPLACGQVLLFHPVAGDDSAQNKPNKGVMTKIFQTKGLNGLWC